tara:strand:+ start:1719 stop:2096 length:378 start_codon:yes stop_codon:yes gene_type:complete
MKKLLITLLLISPFSFADWGDVYSCQMISFKIMEAHQVIHEERALPQPEKFSFKLDKTKNAMVFDKKGYFDGAEKRVMMMMNSESWYAKNVAYDAEMPDFGGFMFTYTNKQNNDDIWMGANCDKL